MFAQSILDMSVYNVILLLFFFWIYKNTLAMYVACVCIHQRTQCVDLNRLWIIGVLSKPFCRYIVQSLPLSASSSSLYARGVHTHLEWCVSFIYLFPVIYLASFFLSFIIKILKLSCAFCRYFVSLSPCRSRSRCSTWNQP